MNKFIVFGLLVIVVFFYSCGTTAPLKEKNLAESKISQAKEVNANVYADKELKDSESSYNKAEKLIEPEKKSTSNTKALEQYLGAIASADAAYDKSVGPYTKSIIDDFDDSLMSADEEYGLQNSSPTLFNSTVEELDKAKDSYEDKNYSPVIGFIKAGEMKLEEAIAEAERLKEEAEAAISRFDGVLNEAKVEHKIHNATPDLFALAMEEFDSANDDYDEYKYLSAIERVGLAESNVGDAVTEAMRLKQEVALQNNQIELLIQEANAKKAQAATPNEYSENLSAFDAIKSQNREGYYAKSLEEYPLLKEEFEIMFEIIEEKRLLASKEISEAEGRIVEVQEQNTALEEEVEELQ